MRCYIVYKHDLKPIISFLYTTGYLLSNTYIVLPMDEIAVYLLLVEVSFTLLLGYH